MLNLSLDELKQIAKMIRIKGYKSIPKERLLSTVDESESAGRGNSFYNAKVRLEQDYRRF